MDLFTVIEEAFVLVSRKGVYRQAKVYRRGDKLYAGHGAGLVRLCAHGTTTVPDVKWLEIDGPDIVAKGTKEPRMIF